MAQVHRSAAAVIRRKEHHDLDTLHAAQDHASHRGGNRLRSGCGSSRPAPPPGSSMGVVAAIAGSRRGAEDSAPGRDRPTGAGGTGELSPVRWGPHRPEDPRGRLARAARRVPVPTPEHRRPGHRSAGVHPARRATAHLSRSRAPRPDRGREADNTIGSRSCSASADPADRAHGERRPAGSGAALGDRGAATCANAATAASGRGSVALSPRRGHVPMAQANGTVVLAPGRTTLPARILIPPHTGVSE